MMKMNIFRKVSFPAQMLAMFTLVACVDQTVQEVESDTELITTEDLSFTNFEEIEVNVSLSDGQKEPVSGALVKFYDASNLLEGAEIIKGLTGADGSFSMEVNLGNHIEELVMVTNYIGLQDYLIIPRSELSYVSVQGITSAFTSISEIPGQSSEESTSGRGVTKNVGARTQHAAITYLSGYDGNGVPNNLEAERDVVSSELLSYINASLPEGKPVPVAHPRYLDEDAERNLVVEETADVWMTFVHEGAGYRNVLAYYTYPTGSEPQSVDDIEEFNVVFPNASFAGSGGGLYTGDKVYLGQFGAGTTIGFALMANGWRGGEATHGYHVVYSNNALNPESTEEKRFHSVLLYDDTNELFLIGLEDLNRDGRSDDDFNDAMFYITANPIEAIKRDNVNPIDKPGDSDGDGVNDTYDEYPDDARYAYRYSYPGENSYGSFAFEDQWPAKGDYDFNDLVADYNYRQLVNASNKMVKIEAEFVIQAVGAGFKNGLGIQLDIAPLAISNVSGNQLSTGLFALNGNGTEAGQSKAVIPITDDAHSGFEGRGFINTDPSLPYQTPDTIVVDIDLTSGLELNGAGIAPFNPFLVINQTRGRELHISGYSPTDLVDASYFGNGNDNTSIDEGRYYTTKTSLPWGMNLPVSFKYPEEKNDIRNGFNHFNQWNASGGFSFLDWYTDKPGYRNSGALYNKR